MIASCPRAFSPFVRIQDRMLIGGLIAAHAGGLSVCSCKSGRFNPKISYPRTGTDEGEAHPNGNEKLFRLAQKAARMFAWEMNLETRSVAYSANAKDLLGADPLTAFYPGGANIHPDDRHSVEKSYERALSAGESFTIEYRLVVPGKGRTIWVRNEGSFDNYNRNGQRRFFGVVQDITELKAAQGIGEALGAEMQHVTRNLLTIVRAISSQILCSSPSLDEYDARFHGRLCALSRIQGLLYRGGSKPVTIAEVAGTVIASMSDGPDTARVAFDGPEVVLPRKFVQILTLSLHELALNAAEHGALSIPGGRIRISWLLQHVGSGGKKLKFIWSESGLILSEETSPPRQGFGRFLLERALPYELNAKTGFELGRDGIRWTIELPLPTEAE